MERPPWTPDDSELALRVACGQEWAFEELLERHGDLLHFTAQALYAPGETYDDLLQAARLGLYRAALSYDPSRGVTFRTFAALAVRAAVIDAVVTATRRKHTPLNASARLQSPVAGLDGEDAELGDILPGPASAEPEARVLAREELEGVVSIVVTRLSELERTVLARRLNGLSLAQCGAGLGSAERREKTADNALQRIRRKLAA